MVRLRPHAEHDVGPRAVGGHHLRDDVGVVLQVGVDAHHGVRAPGRHVQACQQGRLVPDVGGQVEAVDAAVLAVELLDERPSAVRAAVVDKEDVAPGVGVARGYEAVDHRSEATGGLFDDCLFAVARDDDG